MIDGILRNDTSSKGGIKSLMNCYQIRNRSNSLRYTAEINLALFIIDHEARDVDGNLFKKNCEQETEPRNVTFYLHWQFGIVNFTNQNRS